MNRSLLSIGIFLLLIIGLGVATFTRGGLGYFAPDTLEFTVELEYTVLDGRIPIYRSRRQAVSYPLLDYLRQSGYVDVLPGPPRKWDEEFHCNSAWKDGYSDFHRVLTRESHSFIEWSKADPERAKLFWSTYFRWRRTTVERGNWAASHLLTSISPRRTLEEVSKNIADIETEYGLPLSATGSSEVAAP